MDTYSKQSVRDNYADLVTKKAVEIFGDDLANPCQEPVKFRYQVKFAEMAYKRDMVKV